MSAKKKRKTKVEKAESSERLTVTIGGDDGRIPVRAYLHVLRHTVILLEEIEKSMRKTGKLPRIGKTEWFVDEKPVTLIGVRRGQVPAKEALRKMISAAKEGKG